MFATHGAVGEAVEPGASFPLLAGAPASHAAATGRRFVLVADSLGSARVGDPVYHRGVQVGTVTRSWLVPDGTAAAMEVAIEDEHAALVRERSVFWNASGIDADLSLLHPSLDIESPQALLRGGVAFATPADGGRRRAVLSFGCTARPKAGGGCSARRRGCTSCSAPGSSARSRSAIRSTTARSRSASDRNRARGRRRGRCWFMP